MVFLGGNIPGRSDLPAVVTGAKDVPAVQGRFQREKAILVGLHRFMGDALPVLVQMPGHDLRVADGLAGERFQDKSLDPFRAGADNQRQFTNPHVRHGDHVLRFSELGIVAGRDEVEAGLEIQRSR